MLRPLSPAARAARASHRANRARTLVEAGLRTPQGPKGRRKRLGRREEPRRSSYFRDPGYLAWLRERPCGVRVACLSAGIGLAYECSLRIDPEHQREGIGAGQRAPDPMAWACCRRHHDQRHDGRGFFDGASLEMVRDFVRARISECQAAYYGRALDESDLPTVRAAVEAGAPTFQLFNTAAEPRGARA